MESIDEMYYWPSRDFAPWATVWPEAIGTKNCGDTLLSKKNGGYFSYNYLRSGTLQLRLGQNATQTIKGGTAFVIQPGQLYHYIAPPAAMADTVLFWVRLAGPNAENHVKAMGIDAETQQIKINHPSKLNKLTDRFMALYHNYDARSSNAEAVALLYQMISASNPGLQQDTRNAGTLAMRIRDFIYDELELGYNISQIAQFFGISRSSLFLHFKREFGETPISVLKLARLEKACHLLIETDLAVEEIARASGYSNLSHFMHQFKAEYNTTPASYRKSPPA
jgi:AraC-like DNA-binding protein